MQIFATAIANPCYRIYADIRGHGAEPGSNPRHYLQHLFKRRLRQGRVHRTPCLGLSEFVCDYWGPFRPEWEVDSALSLEIQSMLSEVWDQPITGKYVSRFVPNAMIEKGVLEWRGNREEFEPRSTDAC